MSLFNQMMAEALPAMQEVLSEPVGNYFSPGKTVATLAIFGTLQPITFRDPGYDPSTDELTREEITKITGIERAKLAGAQVLGFERGAWVVIAGERWELDEAETRWGQVTVTLGLKRIPLVRTNENRSAAV